MTKTWEDTRCETAPPAIGILLVVVETARQECARRHRMVLMVLHFPPTPNRSILAKVKNSLQELPRRASPGPTAWLGRPIELYSVPMAPRFLIGQ